MDWFTGNGRYMTLRHCMADDTLWIDALVSLSLIVLTGYFFIAHHAWSKYREAKSKSAMARTLLSFVIVFVLCGLCGYGFNILRMVWPAYRLLVIALVFLSFYTWRLYWQCKKQQFFEILFSEHVGSNGK